MMIRRWFHQLFRCLIPAGVLLCSGATVSAQAPVPTVPAIFLSDIHLDPFYDPAKVQRLFAAPAEAWSAILAEPDSPGRGRKYAALQKTCSMIGTDSSYSLVVSALQAAHRQVPDARFVTVTGDLLGHKFDCHFNTLLPHKDGAAYQAFVSKTERAVLAELRRRIPGVPIYVALGNNDSDCADYQLEPNGAFLKGLAPVVIRDMAKVTGIERTNAIAAFSARGDYSLTLPAPMQHTRLIVINDVFHAPVYQNCRSRTKETPATEQIAWLRGQIADARERKQQVWVMGHMPPGIDLYATALHFRDVCTGQAPVTFLADDRLDQALLSGGGVIRLALFAHTHMDEMRLLQPPGEPTANDIPLKMISSISPVNGNKPSFTTARIDPATAVLVDFSVFSASNRAGINATWDKRYTYSETYREPAFDGVSLDRLTEKFLADRKGATPESQEYIRNYFAGLGPTLTPLWSAYVCVIDHMTPQSYAACACQKK